MTVSSLTKLVCRLNLEPQGRQGVSLKPVLVLTPNTPRAGGSTKATPKGGGKPPQRRNPNRGTPAGKHGARGAPGQPPPNTGGNRPSATPDPDPGGKGGSENETECKVIPL